MARASGLGRILRDIKEDKTSDKISVIREIDKAFSEGITYTGAFSVIGIKRSLKLLESMLDEGFEREPFFKEFFKLYNLMMAPDMRAKNVFHPSSLLEDCPRRLTYDLLKTAPTDAIIRPISPALQRIFDVGSWYHLYIQNILYTTGLLEQAEVPVINTEKYINGKADGVFFKKVFGKKTVLEIKSMNHWNFQKAIFKPFKKHEFQASLYGRELDAELILFLYIDKDTSEMKEFLVPVNEEMLAQADKKMNLIVDCVKTKTLPARKCGDKLCEDALACPFTSLCFK